MESTISILARNISMLRKRKALTQEKLAELTGVSYQAVSKWENEKSTPEIALLPVLAEIFECTIDDLFANGISSNNIIKDVLWENDDKIRCVVFEGTKMLCVSSPEDLEALKKFTFEILGDAKNIECHCNVSVSGSVSSGVNAGGEVIVCGHLTGNVNSQEDVTVGFNLTGGVNAHGEVTVGGNITGGIDTNSDVIVKGNISAKKIECKGNIEVAGEVEADKIVGNVDCNQIKCEKIEGNVMVKKASE